MRRRYYLILLFVISLQLLSLQCSADSLSQLPKSARLQREKKKRESEESEAFDRLRRVCKDRDTYPYIKCRWDATKNDFLLKAGTYGAGVIADLMNEPDKYGVEVFADSRVTSALEDPELAISTTDKNKLDPKSHPSIPVFIKTAQFRNVALQDALETTRISSSFVREQRRCRALAGQLLSPVIYDVVHKDSDVVELSDDFYIMQYFEAENLHRLLQLAFTDWSESVEPILKTIKTSLQAGRAVEAREAIEKFLNEGWLRVRTFFGIVDSALGIVKRLWARYYRHCDLHAGNIMATMEWVHVKSDYFEALILKGRGASPLDLNGYQLADVVALRETLLKEGVTKVRFFVLHPRRFRLIDLAYLINIRDLKKEIGPTLSGVCRTGSADRREDVFELDRMWQLLKDGAQDMNQQWQKLRAANEFNMMANDPSLKSNIEGIDQYVQQMIDAVGQIYVTIIDKNKEWNDCQKYVQSYVTRRRTATIDDRIRLRQNWNSLSKFRCTVEQEEHGLEVAQARLLELAQNVLDPNLPNGYSNSIIGPKTWPQCPPLREDVAATHFSHTLSLSKSA